jgi:hypothetical protein
MVATLERLIRGEHVEAMTPVPIELVRRGSS